MSEADYKQPRAPQRFSRERFLLRLVALVLLSQVSVYAFGAGVCAWQGRLRPPVPGGLCARFDTAIESAFGVALNTLLALLGGKALSDSTKTPAP